MPKAAGRANEASVAGIGFEQSRGALVRAYALDEFEFRLNR